MSDIMESSVFSGMLLSLFAYCTGLFLRKKTGLAVMNPLLTASVITGAFLVLTGTDYSVYYQSAEYLSRLLTPATVCLAIPLYRQAKRLRNHLPAVTAGIFSGVVTSLVTVLSLSLLLGFTREEYVTFLPKSVTTAIGIGVSEELGGCVPLTAAVIIITGIIGSVFSDAVFRLLRIREPAAKGTALGSAAHAVGTSKALELGEIEGAVSSLSIAVSGIVTVPFALIFDKLWDFLQ